MLNPKCFHAYVIARRVFVPATQALTRARAHPTPYGHASTFNAPARNVTRQPNRPRYAWIENTESAGLRFVNFADQFGLRSIDHRGWYTCENGDNGENYRGVVYRLPHSRGLIAGYADPNNRGAAFVELSLVDSDDEIGAAHRADDIARIEAEKEFTYQEVWNAAQRANECESDARDIRKSLLALLSERGRMPRDMPNACRAFRDRIESFLNDIANLRRERDKLDSNYAHSGAYRSERTNPEARA